MANSLYGRISAVLIALLCANSILYIGITLHFGQLYREHVKQSLNGTLAHNLVKETGLTLHHNRFDEQLLKEIFSTYRVVDPRIEVYLLNRKGRILASSPQPEKIKRNHVDLQPVYRLLSHRHLSPIAGDDPRDPTGKKIFSAAPVGPTIDPDGYLYVVLEAQPFGPLANRLQDSAIGRLGTATVIASLAVSVLLGLVFFHSLTRRLQRLDAAMAKIRLNDFGDRTPARNLNLRCTDEAGRLERTFRKLMVRVAAQANTLEQTDSRHRELVAGISHDLRPPITSLQGYLRTLVLKDATLSADERHHYLEVALSHTQRLGQLTDELLEIAKLDAQHVRLKRETIALGNMVQDVALKFRQLAERRDIALTTRVPNELPSVDADLGMIERALEGLLDHTLHHTRRGGNVQLSLLSDGVHVSIKVTASGTDEIDDSDLSDEFEQGQPDMVEIAAAGLSLVIAKRILELHDSPMQVTHLFEGGTAFTFRLPVASPTGM